MTDAPRSSGLPRDEDDPYEGADLSTYPDWWRRNVEEHRSHDLRPYRPPRFADDVLTPPLIAALEAELGVDVRMRSVDPQDGNDWELVVDDRYVATVEHDREAEGFTRYGITANRFEELVRTAVAPTGNDA